MSNDEKKPTDSKPSGRRRTQNYRGNARGLNKHEKEENQDNYTMLQGFEWHSKGGGVYWKEMKEKVASLGDMGITAMWLPPPTKASSQEGNGYDIYDLWDLGEFDAKGGKATKWGTKEEYIDLIKTAKEHGVVVYADAVLNHKAGADFPEKFHAIEVDPEDRNKDLTEPYEIEGWTGFNFPGRKGAHSKMEWHHYHFTGVDWDNKNKKKAIFKIQGDGKDWAEDVDGEKGSFDYLMFSDIDHDHPEVIKDIIDWGVWLVEETGIAGFRFDACKHFSSHFLRDFVRQVRDRTGNEDLMSVGELWQDSLDTLSSYLDVMDEQFSVFDTPLHYNFKEAADRGQDYDIRAIFDGTVVQSQPIDAVTLVDNHDTQPGEALESWVAPWFKPLAYALILFRLDGYPCVFAGDLYGCNSEPFVEPMNQLDDFIRIRKNFSYGATRDYQDHANCWGWVREGDADHPNGCAVVICNGSGEGEKRMQIPDGHAGEKWVDALGWYQGEVTIGDDGWADFKCNARSVSVWVNKDAPQLKEFQK
ncbi:putative alpha-amylase [Leucosporidium creatinivorum]|uniref:Putative alpha-amylase n=1 Tax=Leucosporidium creatinivorum TaxID=106004 RepID=A0A1Y2G1Z6_9BASI|nr:putative alpha-amylase [Leucosporidium creatinivorum]